MDILVVDKFYLLLQGERCDDGGGLDAPNPDLRQAESGVSARHSGVECVENSGSRALCGPGFVLYVLSNFSCYKDTKFS